MMRPSCVSACLIVKNIGKPCAGKPHARFDEGREIDGHWFSLSTRRLLPTLPDPLQLIQWPVNRLPVAKSKKLQIKAITS